MSEFHRIEAITAFVFSDKQGEGVMGCNLAKELCKANGLNVRVIRLSQRTEVATINENGELTWMNQ